MTDRQELGYKFRAWCVRMGRPVPPEQLVDAMNTSFDSGVKEVKSLAGSAPEVYRAYRSFFTRMQ